MCEAMLGRVSLLTLCCATLLTPAARCQEEDDPPSRGFIARLEGGSLNPDDPFATSIAYGGTAGWQVGDRDAFLLRFTHQYLTGDVRGFPWDDVRNLLAINWERSFGAEGRYRQEFMVRLGAGVALRDELKAAALGSAGVAIRYRVARTLGFVGGIEDQVLVLPKDQETICYSLGPPPACDTYTQGDKPQHNFGLFIAAEWKP